jgi:hypothetical protein
VVDEGRGCAATGGDQLGQLSGVHDLSGAPGSPEPGQHRQAHRAGQKRQLHHCARGCQPRPSSWANLANAGYRWSGLARTSGVRPAGSALEGPDQRTPDSSLPTTARRRSSAVHPGEPARLPQRVDVDENRSSAPTSVGSDTSLTWRVVGHCAVAAGTRQRRGGLPGGRAQVVPTRCAARSGGYRAHALVDHVRARLMRPNATRARHAVHDRAAAYQGVGVTQRIPTAGARKRFRQ